MMKRVALALSCATVALALRPVPPPPRAVQSKAAKKVAAGMAAAVLAGASTLPLSSLALSADDYDAIYGMSATGSKGSSIKFEMPSFGGDDASDTSAADKKKAADAAAAKEADAKAATVAQPATSAADITLGGLGAKPDAAKGEKQQPGLLSRALNWIGSLFGKKAKEPTLVAGGTTGKETQVCAIS